MKKMCLCRYCIEEMRSRGERLRVGEAVALEYEVFADEPQVCTWCGEEGEELYMVEVR